MEQNHTRQIVYVVSDSVGETAELVVRAASSQFQSVRIEIRRVPYCDNRETVDEVIEMARDARAIIAFTLVIPDIKEYLIQQANIRQVETVDIMWPMLEKISKLTNKKPRYEPGLVYRLDDDYFRKVDAIEFAVKYDDGRDPRGIMRADIVLMGVSRTSKTPLSQYLAHKRFKVANVPLVPEVEPPEELFKVSRHKCIGLKISAEKLNEIRTERLKSLGLKEEASYASLERIKYELEFAEKIMKKIGCTVIDVSNKAVEETGNLIANMFRQQ